MEAICLYPVGITDGCKRAAVLLKQAGIRTVDHPSPEVTHVLLDVPAFGADGRLRGGADADGLLEMLPENVTVIGGKLDHPVLAEFSKLDLLKDEGYLAENAAITADCALGLARPLLKTTLRDTPMLILGWGRIGKCLGQMVKALGADVTIAARKESHRAMLRALGYRAVDFSAIHELAPDMSLIFNTVPAKVLDCDGLPGIKIDLASTAGLWGDDVIYARGLPGIHAPESAGGLIAKTILKNLKEGQK